MDYTPPYVNRLSGVARGLGTEQYNTQLTPQQEEMYQVWRSKLPTYPAAPMGRPGSGLQYEDDYDLRGAFLQNLQAVMSQADGKPHMGDQFKKPNHPSFSDQSQYSVGPTMYGGSWQGEQFTPAPINQLYQALMRGR